MSRENPVGIMQGRLSPAQPGRPQAFPWGSWQEEFDRARAGGFELIEWLFDTERHEENPLWSPEGRAQMRAQSQRTGVRTTSLCANWFLAQPLFRGKTAETEGRIAVLRRLIDHAAVAGIATIVLPMLEDATPMSAHETETLAAALAAPLEDASARGVRLALETDWSAADSLVFLDRCGSTSAGICYDAGNATAAGRDIGRDVRRLAHRLFAVHVKDRRRGGERVALGEGDTDFVALFEALREVGYRGSLILETPQGDDWQAAAEAHRRFVQSHLQDPAVSAG